MNRKTLLMSALILLGWSALAQAQEKPSRPPATTLPGIKVHKDLDYVQDGHERNKLDLYLSETTDGPRPVVVWIHGGAWRGGSKEGCPAIPLVGRGYAVASINYRLSQHAPFPAQIEDCKAAIRWLRANARKYSLDPDHIGVWGASAGGHLVALLGTTGDVKDLDGKGGNPDQSSRVQAVCDWFGPTDLTRMFGNNKNADTVLSQLVGGPIGENKDKAARASPVTYVTKDDAPFLIMHGDEDPTVPLSQSEVLAESLKKAGVNVRLQVLKGSKHGGPAFLNPESRQVIVEFFDKYLKKDGKAAEKVEK